MKMLSGLTQQQLKEVLHYNPDTGIFTRMAAVNKQKSGAIAGSINNLGYRVIGINKKSYLAHRLAWLYMTGEWPKIEIDHINGVKDNNSIINLREATKSQNKRNSPTQSNNTSGYKGVTWYKLTNKWHAVASLNGKNKHLGYYLTAELASQAYKEFTREHHGEFIYSL